MGKIGKLKLFSEYYNIDSQELYRMGIFNPILNLDTQLFIDPVLLRSSRHELIKNDAVSEYNEYFSRLISLLSMDQEHADYTWELAKKLFPKREIDGTCLGYGANSTSGRGISDTNKEFLLSTAKKIISIGIKDPNLFSILPLFNEGIGPDTISDITTRAIHKSLLRFTCEKANELGILTESIEIYGTAWNVIPNPTKPGSNILLIPNDILRNLPIVQKWKDIEKAASFNSNLRNRVNKLLSELFKQKTTGDKNNYVSKLLKDKEFLEDLITIIKECSGSCYDQKTDNERIVVWGKATELIKGVDVEKKSFKKDLDGLTELVRTIIERFKFLVEQKGLNKLLWKEDKTSRCKESVAQLIFHAVALIYCEANDVDVSPETSTGTGLIDFKFSHGYRNKIVVEIKYSDSPSILSGYQKQLQQYKVSEETDKGMYVVLDIGKNGSTKYKELQNISREQSSQGIFYVDVTFKESASKLK